MNTPSNQPENEAREIFLQALNIHNPGERRAYLDKACGKDSPLRERVQTLLANHKDDSFLEAPAQDAPTIKSDASILLEAKPSPPAPADRIRYFGDYELLEEIARGGMGVVYKARQTSLNRIVAVKMILSGELASEKEVRRFHTEAEAAANLQHPNIVAIHEVGEHEGRHYFSMDYVEGESLADYVRRHGKLSPVAAAKHLLQIAEAVQYANQRGILHRDLKPQNVLMDKDGRMLVTDFGLAKKTSMDGGLTITGAIMGSPSFMPPEQARGRLDEAGPASEVYGLGAILYYCLTGNPPFMGENAVATIAQVVDRNPVPPQETAPEIPGDLATICLKCLEKRPDARYPSARALMEELERFLNREPILAKPAGAARKAWNWVQRHPWVLAGCGAAVVLAFACLAYGLWENHKRYVWTQEHEFHASPWVFYGPLLRFWIFVFPTVSLAGYFASAFFKRHYAGKDRRRGRMFRSIWLFYILLGLTALACGLWGTLQAVKLNVWMRDWPSFFVVMATLPWTLCLLWLGSSTLWEAAGAHESSVYGDALDERVAQYLKYHPNRWSILEIGLFTLSALAAWGFVVAYLHFVLEEWIGPGSILAWPYLLNFPIAAALYLATARFSVKTAGVKTAAIGIGAIVAASVVAFSLIDSLFDLGPSRFHEKLFLVRSSEKASVAILFPIAFGLLLAGFEKIRNRWMLIRRLLAAYIVLGMGGALAGLLKLVGAYPDWVGHFLLVACAAAVCATPSILLRGKRRYQGLDVVPGDGMAGLARWVWSRKIWIAAAAMVLLAGIVIENRRGANAWKKAQAAWTGHGRPANYSAMLSDPISDEQNYWMAPIVRRWIPVMGREAGVRFVWDQYEWEELKSLPAETPQSDPDAPSLAKLRALHQSRNGEFQQLLEAARRPGALLGSPEISPRGYSLPETAPLPNFVQVRHVAWFLNHRAQLFLLTRETDQSLGSLEAMSGLIRALESSPPTLVSIMIRGAVAGLGIETIRNGLKEGLWRAVDYPALRAFLNDVDFINPYYRSILAERNSGCELLERFASIPYPQRLQEAFSMGFKESWVTMMLLEGWVRQNQAVISNLIHPYVSCLESKNPRVDSKRLDILFEEISNATSKPTIYNTVARLWIPNFLKASRAVSRHQAMRDMALIALDLENDKIANAVYPASLDDLRPAMLTNVPLDVVSDRPYRYRRTENGGFLLYSVGWNQIDDGGKDSPKNEVDASDWVW